MPTFIIAEAACTWRGTPDELGTLRQIAEAVKSAGADALKIQWCSSAVELAIQRNTTAHGYRLLTFDRDLLPKFAALCLEVGLEPMCSVFLPTDVSVVAHHVSRYKVASLEARSIELVRAYAEVPAKPLYVSVGAMSVSAVADTRALWKQHKQPDVSFLQCCAAYPAPLSGLSLGWLRSASGIAGLSDHSHNLLTGSWAVAAGATVIETHVRSEHCATDNPDYPVSFTLDELALYVRLIRTAEVACGMEKRVHATERALVGASVA